VEVGRGSLEEEAIMGELFYDGLVARGLKNDSSAPNCMRV
jgi:hypothetical protein